MPIKHYLIWFMLIISWTGCRNRNPIIYAELEKTAVENSVLATGYVVDGSGYNNTVSSPASGIIVSIKVHEEQHVRTGMELATIENSEFITLQQEYLEARNLFAFYSEEYSRQGDLTVENATTMKKLQLARRDFQSAEIKFNALALQLKILGISPDSLKSDRLLRVLPVNAFRSGIVSEIIHQPRAYVHTGDPLFIIVSEKRPVIKLKISEKDFLRVSKGQTVDCFSVYDSLSKIKAIICSVEQEIDPLDHTSAVYAEISATDLPVIPGMSVRARIYTGTDSVSCLNSNAVLNEKNTAFIVVKEKGSYRKVPVQVGPVRDGKTEIHGLTPEMSDSVVISGFEELRTMINL